MGKLTGFMDFERMTSEELSALERIENFDEFHIPLTLEEQKKQGGRCMDCGVPFCQSGMTIGGKTSGCPLGNLIPEWNDLIYHEEWELAFRRLSVTNRFPEFTSRVCPALCEASCICGLASGDSVTVRENERTIVDMAYEKGWRKAVQPPVRTGKSVAIVGSGPAGLAAADYLNKRGHSVTVYERDDRPGGLLMYGIPNMKLSKKTVRRRIRLMQEEGVIFETGVDVGRTVSAEELREKHDAVVLCCGARKVRGIPAKGQEAVGVYQAVEFLSGVTKSLLDSRFADGKAVNAEGKHVIVIGGGDTGNDCVGTVVRQKCASVLQLVKRPAPPTVRPESCIWPEQPELLKTDYGQQEAIAVFGEDPRRYLTQVKEFRADENGCLKEAVLEKLISKKDEKTGRRITVPSGEERTVPCDLALIAQGFTGCEDYIAQVFGVELTAKGNVADKEFATNVPGVFVCGDMRRGSSLVVWALREGRDAARAVDEALMGYSNL